MQGMAEAPDASKGRQRGAPRFWPDKRILLIENDFIRNCGQKKPHRKFPAGL
jgi:hypothetical protein